MNMHDHNLLNNCIFDSIYRLLRDDVFDVARVVVPRRDGVLRGVWMRHHAHRVWPHMHRGDLHFYGHSHDTLPGTAASTDVGVECFGFRPVTIDEIHVRLAESAARDGGTP